jgi:hypothetical protein
MNAVISRGIKSAGLALVMLNFFTGCATVYRQPDNVYPKPRPDKGLVYFYRESSFVGGGVSYYVNDGDKRIGGLKNGTYFYTWADPGTHNYWAKTEARAEKTLSVETNKTYYVRGEVGMGFFVGHPKLTIVSEDEGKSAVPHSSYATIEEHPPVEESK